MKRTLVLTLMAALGGCAGEMPSNEELSSAEDELKLGKRYLALGDSVAFGYNPEANPDKIKEFIGYPELISLLPFPTTNPSCMGETTDSFITFGAPDNGCGQWRVDGNAMHVKYDPGQSQLAYAKAFLTKNGKNTATVSVGIGANDLLLLQTRCGGAGEPPTDPGVLQCIGSGGDPAVCVATCIQTGAPATILSAAQKVGYILGELRSTGYTGQLVVVTYYALNYADQTDLNLQAIYGLNRALVTVAQTPGLNASVAKGFSTFAALSALKGGDACAAGLLYKMADGSCDKHPSALGHAVLAAAVAAAVPATSINLNDPNAQF